MNSKGFTLIELIVVIAIIAILAAIVMVNVVQYIQNSKIAAIKADMDAMKTESIAYYADPSHGTYNGFLDEGSPENQKFRSVIPAIIPSGGYNVYTDGKNFCMTAYDISGFTTGEQAWCVDSNGYAGMIDSYYECGGNGAVCK